MRADADLALRTPSSFGHVMRRQARTFSFAARFLDPERRRAVEILYAFFRTLDDLVDERPDDADIDAIRAELRRWKAFVCEPERAGSATDPLARALAATMLHYRIPPAYLCTLIRGLEDDLDNRPILTFEDLERYALRVAGSVGLAMCPVLGATSTAALAAASALGIAMQLTNIVRDVAADLNRGRVYLPADDLNQFPGAAESLAARTVSPPLQAVLRLQVTRARRYYQWGALGIRELPYRVRPPILIASALYEEILAQVENRGLDVFAGRAVVSRQRKLVLAGRALLRLAQPMPPASHPYATNALGPAALSELASVGVTGLTDVPPPPSVRVLAGV